MEITVHKISEDGLPAMETLVGRVAFIFDGNIVSGWPLIPDELDDPSREIVAHHEAGDTLWEADSDVGRTTPFSGVTHWVEFPYPVLVLASES